jgi:hypothetical protein
MLESGECSSRNLNMGRTHLTMSRGAQIRLVFAQHLNDAVTAFGLRDKIPVSTRFAVSRSVFMVKATQSALPRGQERPFRSPTLAACDLTKNCYADWFPPKTMASRLSCISRDKLGTCSRPNPRGIPPSSSDTTLP